MFDLEERLLEYASEVIRFVEKLPRTRAGNHVAAQLLRCGTSALPNHGEAQAAESAADFIHKMSICLKELRETNRWLRLCQRVPQLLDVGRSMLSVRCWFFNCCLTRKICLDWRFVRRFVWPVPCGDKPCVSRQAMA